MRKPKKKKNKKVLRQEQAIKAAKKLAGASKATPSNEGTRHVGRNAASSVGAKILYLVTRFFLPPITLAYISLEEYGVWAICFMIIGYLGMSAFGVSNVYIRYVADYHARGETHRISGLLSTGVTVVSVLGIVILGFLWFGLPFLIERLSVSPALRDMAFELIFGTSAVFVLELSWGAFAYVLTGLQRIVEQNKVWVLTFILETVLSIGFLVAGLGVYGLLYAFAIRYLVSISLNVLLCYRAVPGLNISLFNFSREYLPLFLRYGAILQISGLLSMFLRSVEKLIAGLFINVQATGLFDVGEKFPVMSTSIPSSMNAVFLPAATYVNAQDRREEMFDLYLKSARYINLITGFMMGFMAAFSAPIMVAWLGPNTQYALAPLILTCFTLPFHLNVLTGPATNMYRGMGIPARELIYPVSQLILVVVFVAFGFHYFGKDVVVITATVAAAMILSALFYMIYTNRFLRFSQMRFLRVALLPGLWPYLTGFVIYLGLAPWLDGVMDNRWESTIFVVAAGLAYCVVQFGVLWVLQLFPEERRYISTKLRRRRSVAMAAP